MTLLHQKIGHVLDERGRPTNVQVRSILGCKGQSFEHGSIDATGTAWPAVAGFAGKRVGHVEIAVALRESVELVPVDDRVPSSR